MTRGRQNEHPRSVRRYAAKVFAVCLAALMLWTCLPSQVAELIADAFGPYKTETDVYSEVNTVETVTKYQYRTKSVTTDLSPQLEGWTLYETEITGWSDWSEWQRAAVTATDYRKVETKYIQPTYKTVYQYFHYCNSAGTYWGNCVYESATIYHTTTFDNKLTNYKENTYGSGGYYLSDKGCPNGCTKWYVGTDYTGANPTKTVEATPGYTMYRYMDADLLYHFYQWSPWSAWDRTPVEPSDTVEVLSRVVNIDEYGVEYSEDYSKIYKVPTALRCREFRIPESVTEICESAFENCAGIERVVLHDGLVKIGANSFRNCDGLEEITFPESVAWIGDGAFSGCDNLGGVYFRHKKPITVGAAPFADTALDCIFVYFLQFKDDWLAYQASWAGFPLEGYDPPGQLYSNVDENDTDELGFVYAYDAAAVTASVVGYRGGSTAIMPRRIVKDSVSYNVTAFTADAFSGNTTLKSLTLTKAIGAIPANACKGCTALQEIRLEGTLKQLGSGAFMNCTSLKSFDHLSKLTEIPANAFNGCTSLGGVSLPGTLVTIGDSAFENCRSFVGVTIPASVKTIGVNAFKGCTGIQTAVFNGTPNRIGNTAFAQCSNLSCADFKADPPAGIGSSVFPGGDHFFIQYRSNNAQWNRQVSNEKWNGFFAYSVNLIARAGSGLVRPWIIKVTNTYGDALKGAAVTVNGSRKTTDSYGTAVFQMPTGSTASVTVQAGNYATVSYGAYRLNKKESTAVFSLGAVHSISSVKFNGTNVLNGYSSLNRAYSGSSDFEVNVSSPFRIKSLELLSGNTVIAKKTNVNAGTHIFTVYHKSFKKDAPVVVRMQTRDGKTLQKTLKIGVFDPVMLDLDIGFKKSKDEPNNDKQSDPQIDLSATGEDILSGIKLTIPLQKWTKLSGMSFSYKNNPDTFELGINTPQPKWDKDLIKEVKNKYGRVERGLSVSGGLVASLEVAYNAERKTFYFPKSSAYLFVKVSVEHSVDVWLYILPLTMDIGLSGELLLRFSNPATFDGQKFRLSCNFDPTLKVKGEASLGIGNKWASAGVYGGFTLEWKIPSKLYGSGSVGGYGRAGCWEYRKEFANWKKTQLLPRKRSASRTSDSFRREDLYDISAYAPIERDYLAVRSAWLGSPAAPAAVNAASASVNAVPAAQASVLQTNAYSYLEPQLVRCNGVTMMVYADDIAGRTAENLQGLVYSVYDESAGTWTAPALIADSGTMDNYYRAFSDGSDIYVVYTAANKQLPAGATPAQFVSAMDVYAAKYDPASKSFISLGAVTADDTYDLVADLAIVNGTPVAVWASNENGEIFGADGSNRIRMSKLENGVWSEPVTYVRGGNLIPDLAVGAWNGAAVTAAVMDADGDPVTETDRTLVLFSETGESREVGEPGIKGNLQFTTFKGANVLMWYENGQIRYLTDPEGEAQTIDLGETAVDCNFRWVDCKDGRYAITYTSSEEESSNVYALYYDGARWTQPIALTDSEHYVGAYGAVFANGKWMLAYRENEVTFGEDSYETTARLCVTQNHPAAALTVTNVETETGSVPGAQRALTLTVRNNGFADVENAVITVLDPNGGVLLQETRAVSIGAGESSELAVLLTAPDEALDADYTVTVAAEDGGASEAFPFRFWQADLHVEAQQFSVGADNSLIINVTNEGTLPSAPGMLKTALGKQDPEAESEIYAEIELESIAPGETATYTLELSDSVFTDESLNGQITAWVETDGEDANAGNDAMTLAILNFEETELFYDEELVWVAPVLTPDAAVTDLAAVQDVSVEIRENANTFSRVRGLSESDYTYSDGVLTLSAAYLSTLSPGSHTLECVFNEGEENENVQLLLLTVTDTTPVMLQGEISIVGSAVYGETLTVNTDAVTTEDAEYETQWLRDGVCVARTEQYTLTAEDVGRQISAVLQGINSNTGALTAQAVVPVKAPGATVLAPVAKTVGSRTVELTAFDGYQYKCADGAWSDSPVFTDLIPNTEYVFVVRKAETPSHTAGGESTPLTVRTEALPLEGTVTIEGAPERGNTVRAVFAPVSDAQVIFRWYRNDEPIADATQETYTLTPADVGAQIFVKITATGSYAGELISEKITVVCIHEYTWTVTQEPTCTKTGLKTGVCVCGDSKEESLPIVDHTPYTSREAKAATCTAAGNTVEIRCRVCNAVLTASSSIAPTGHRYGDWTALDGTTHRRVCANDPSHVETAAHQWDQGVVESSPTCTAAGVKRYTCAVCGGGKTESLKATGHSYGSWTVVKEPTCTQEGLQQRVCGNDSRHVETLKIQKLAHQDNNGDGACDVCGAKLGGKEESNCVCGKYHTGPFAGLIKFFHHIAYFFKNLFR